MDFEKRDGIYSFLPSNSNDIQLSIKKWDEIYKTQFEAKEYTRGYRQYLDTFHSDVYKQITESKSLKDSIYLEIGCGPFFFGQTIAPECRLVIGIDFCPHALKIAKTMLDEKVVTNYLLIQGDILQMPIKDNKIDLIYGGGVIEHFSDTGSSLKELYRVLKPGGVVINTVPCLNIGSLTYRQLWGNIPNLPIIKQIAEFIHIKILGSRHMIFGYEMSFLKRTLKNMHYEVGFRSISIDRFEIVALFEFVPKPVRKPLKYLAQKSPLFWPMVKVTARK